MFQEFFTDTLMSRYIKTLLQETPLPVFDPVENGDILIAGSYYIYDKFIIQCNTTGRLYVNGNETLYPSDNLYPSQLLLPGTGYVVATFYVKSLLTMHNVKTESTFRSNTNYYDPETHRQLGRYLRYLRTTTGLNLMPYYNCYSAVSIPDIELALIHDTNTSAVVVQTVAKQTHKIVAIPILFGKKYTIATDCPSQVLMKSIIYSNNLNTNITDRLVSTSRLYSSLSFKKPIQYVVETIDEDVYAHHRNLYLIIQLPLSHDASIVVLEDYTETKGIKCTSNNVQKFGFTNSSLLFMSSDKSFAFSNRLIEYLLGNVIHNKEHISKNIYRVQDALTDITIRGNNTYKYKLENSHSHLGVWDDNIQQTVFSLVDELKDNMLLLDQDGFINKDVERLLLLKGAKY